VVSLREGANKLGCLFTLLLVVTIAYFGVNVGEAYLRYFEYRDAIRQEARFAGRHSDDDIRRRLILIADSLGLPAEAGHVQVRRTSNQIEIGASWSEQVELPLRLREIRFTPRIVAPL
jgi:hypothetical protein